MLHLIISLRIIQSTLRNNCVFELKKHVQDPKKIKQLLISLRYKQGTETGIGNRGITMGYPFRCWEGKTLLFDICQS